MLGGENFCRGHEACLATVVEGYEHAHQGHDGLAGADVALQQAVHLSPRADILADFAEHPFLGAGKGKWQDF